MQVSGRIYQRPEDDLCEVIKNQQTIRTTRLKDLSEPLLEKVKWQEEALQRNVLTIRKLNDRAQRAEEQLKRARKKISGLELDIRIAGNQSPCKVCSNSMKH